MRRAEFLMVLAYATDLATGQPRDFALKACVLAMRLAEVAGLDPELRSEVYHQALLRYVGCNADTHLLAAAFGDEIALRQDLAKIDVGNPAELVPTLIAALNRLHAGAPPEELAAGIERGLAQALEVSVAILSGHCEVAMRIGRRLGLSDQACANLGQLYERYDGKGLPHHVKGEAVHFPVRLVALAQDAIVLKRFHGANAMAVTLAERSATKYGPGLVDLLLARSEELMANLDDVGHAEVLALEPTPHALLDDVADEEALLAIADMIDMRMPMTLGHSREVATLAEAAGRRMALPAADLRALRWAGYTHDIGELAVPVAVWLKPGRLGARDADTARLHPYYSERALLTLGAEGQAIAGLVLCHHERVDGSGYHRGVRGPDLSPAARVLAAAEAFQTAREERPHRPALSAAAAASKLRRDVREGGLDADATEAVLAAAGQASRAGRASRLAGVTTREIEVLQLIAAGLTAKEAGRKLGISPKTADNHIQSLYSKIGVTTRAGAALYALEHGLVRQESSAS